MHDLPGEDVLRMVVSQIDFGRSAIRDPSGFIVHHSHKFGL